MEADKNTSKELNSERLNLIKDLVNNSPYYKHIGMVLIRFTENGCVMNMRINEEHSNIYGIAHGGALASLADSTCGLSLVVALNEDEHTVTQNLFINYLRSVPPGVLTTKGRIIHRGKTAAVLEADVFNESGELVAHAQTTHAIRKM
jgi:uncharacterized protein (TIGR00369 family)